MPHPLGERQWKEAVFTAWLKNDQDELARLRAMGELSAVITGLQEEQKAWESPPCRQQYVTAITDGDGITRQLSRPIRML